MKNKDFEKELRGAFNAINDALESPELTMDDLRALERLLKNRTQEPDTKEKVKTK